MKRLPLLLLTAFLSASLPFAIPATAQDARKQSNTCTATYQGEIEDTDPRMNGTNAPYDLITFNAKRGDNLYLRLESTAFPPQVALFQVTETGHDFMEIDWSPYQRRSELFPWIYEDGTYAVRVTPNMTSEPGDPDYTDAQRPRRGYYTLQISPVPCS